MLGRNCKSDLPLTILWCIPILLGSFSTMLDEPKTTVPSCDIVNYFKRNDVGFEASGRATACIHSVEDYYNTHTKKLLLNTTKPTF